MKLTITEQNLLYAIEHVFNESLEQYKSYIDLGMTHNQALSHIAQTVLQSIKEG